MEEESSSDNNSNSDSQYKQYSISLSNIVYSEELCFRGSSENGNLEQQTASSESVSQRGGKVDVELIRGQNTTADEANAFRTSRSLSVKLHSPMHQKYRTFGSTSRVISRRESQKFTPRSKLEIDLMEACPPCLIFYGRWIDYGKTRHLKLKYICENGIFNVKIDNIDMLPMAVFAPSGKPLTPLDLHVGAQVDILGKRLQLIKCSLQSQQWLDGEAVRLMRIKHGLQKEVSKFMHVEVDSPEFHLNPKRVDWCICHNKLAPLGGRVNLRRLLSEVGDLLRVLLGYRKELPKVVAKLLS